MYEAQSNPLFLSCTSRLKNQLLKKKIRATDIIDHLYEKEELNFLSIELILSFCLEPRIMAFVL